MWKLFDWRNLIWLGIQLLFIGGVIDLRVNSEDANYKVVSNN